MNLKTILTTALLVLILFNTTGYGLLVYRVYNQTVGTAVTAVGQTVFTEQSILFYALSALHLATFGVAGALVYKV